MRLLARKDKNGLIINNPAQSMFLFIDRKQLEVSVAQLSIKSECFQVAISSLST